mgnify:CR=1 FL=1
MTVPQAAQTDREYRYLLGTRGSRPLLCLGVNPSTAVPGDLDNTLKSVERIALPDRAVRYTLEAGARELQGGCCMNETIIERPARDPAARASAKGRDVVKIAPGKCGTLKAVNTKEAKPCTFPPVPRRIPSCWISGKPWSRRCALPRIMTRTGGRFCQRPGCGEDCRGGAGKHGDAGQLQPDKVWRVSGGGVALNGGDGFLSGTLQNSGVSKVVKNGKDPMALIPRYQAAIMAKRAAEKK